MQQLIDRLIETKTAENILVRVGRGEEILFDNNCRYLGGVAGNAGLFSNLADLTRFAKMLLAKGAPLFLEKTFALAAQNHTKGMSAARGLGYLYVDARYKQTGGSVPRRRHRPLRPHGAILVRRSRERTLRHHPLGCHALLDQKARWQAQIQRGRTNAPRYPRHDQN